ncbi:MAG TPA: sulfate ABC transporter permease subunit CysT [Caulobacterales bacterium]|nr:sulfate ABC transporter permease subunit CysT [Caulobacterales bacterium]
MSRPRRFRLVEPSALPGFAPALGLTLAYLSCFLLMPLAALALRPWEAGWAHFAEVLTSPRTLAAFKLSFGAAFLAACVNAIFGTIAAWVLVRYDFPGRRLLDALVDLPFALPTAVAGISLAAIYAPNGLVGALFAPHHINIAFTPLGVMIALVFVGFPFIVRSVQPVLEDLHVEVEEAAATLGASRLRTILHVVAPTILPALVAGFSLSFARAVGEYGSVIFIAGNIPMVSEIAPLLIVIRLEEFDYAGAAAVGLLMLVVSFVLLLFLNALQGKLARRGRA